MNERLAVCLKQLRPEYTPEQSKRALALMASVLRLLKSEHGIELRFTRRAPQSSQAELTARMLITNWLKPSRMPGGYWLPSNGAPPYKRATLIPRNILREYSREIGKRIAELQLTNEIRLNADDIEFVKSYCREPGVRSG